MIKIKHLFLWLAFVLCIANSVCAQQGENPQAAPHASGANLAVVSFKTMPPEQEQNSWIGMGFAETITAKIKMVDPPSVKSLYDRRIMAQELRDLGVSQKNTGADDQERIQEIVKAMHELRKMDSVLFGTVEVVGEYRGPDTEIKINALPVTTDGMAVQSLGVISVSGDLNALCDLQTRVAAQYLKALEIPLDDLQSRTLSTCQTENLDVYKQYIQGLSLMDQKKYEEARKLLYMAYEASGRDLSHALEMFGLADMRRIEQLGDIKGELLEDEMAEVDAILDLLDAQVSEKTATTKYVMAGKSIWKAGRCAAEGDKAGMDQELEAAETRLKSFFDLSDKKVVVWRARTESPVAALVLADGSLFAKNEESGLLIDTNNGSLQQSQTPFPETPKSGPDNHGLTIQESSVSGPSLYQEGQTWRVDLPGPVLDVLFHEVPIEDISSEILDSMGNSLAGIQEFYAITPQAVYAVFADTGAVRWRFEAGEEITAAAQDAKAVYIAAGNSVYAVWKNHEDNGPSHFEARLLLAQAELLKGNTSAAEAIVRDLLELDPGYPPALDFLKEIE